MPLPFSRLPQSAREYEKLQELGRRAPEADKRSFGTMGLTNIINSSPRGAVIRYMTGAVALLLLLSWYILAPSTPFRHYNAPSQSPVIPDPVYDSPAATEPDGAHPIDKLIADADIAFQKAMSKQTHNVKDAASVYRERRGRHPPPGFQAWFEYAQEHDAIIVEDFFDTIYTDLAPFWGLEPEMLRRESKHNEMTVNVRDGKVLDGSDWFWTKIWRELVGTIAEYLPDLDMAVNPMDEPRLITPWESINEYMQKERESRKIPPPNEMTQVYGGRAELDKLENTRLNEEGWEKDGTSPTEALYIRPHANFSIGHFFEKARRGCPPESLSRQAAIETDFDHDARVYLQNMGPHSYKGYVQNFTLLSDICHQPDLQSLHGAFIEPQSMKTGSHLFPMFGGSKLSVNNEILLPPPMYYGGEERFSGGEDRGGPWEEKQNLVMWRGVATGGRNTAINWKGFQRHRFIAMINGTAVKRAETWEQIPPNFGLPSKFFDLKSQRNGHLGDWLSTFVDAGFIDLLCHPKEEQTCSYTNDYYKLVEGMPMSDQFHSRYLPDIDGNSFSGRFLGFLASTSLPIKATIFREWHDSRLFAWKHFVPMDNRFLDFFGIMEYFFGYNGFGDEDALNRVPDHDAAAAKIAKAGQDWVHQVLRKEDMRIYVFRLLLEFARVTDDSRDKLGYVADLL
ncbi:MAG: hypothetical protein M1814_006061 [Vezdaea aestivalis]|nr:MAG: hypothetical protein M1814_006061 [Vezdaea aestivalis]